MRYLKAEVVSEPHENRNCISLKLLGSLCQRLYVFAAYTDQSENELNID